MPETEQMTRRQTADDAFDSEGEAALARLLRASRSLRRFPPHAANGLPDSSITSAYGNVPAQTGEIAQVIQGPLDVTPAAEHVKLCASLAAWKLGFKFCKRQR